jgi:hypothetical protein
MTDWYNVIKRSMMTLLTNMAAESRHIPDPLFWNLFPGFVDAPADPVDDDAALDIQGTTRHHFESLSVRQLNDALTLSSLTVHGT